MVAIDPTLAIGRVQHPVHGVMLRSRHELLNARLVDFSKLSDGVGRNDAGTIHKARVASRRLQEFLPVLDLDAGVAARIGRRLRRVTRQLGAIREIDVLVQQLESLGVEEHSGAHSVRLAILEAYRDREKACRRVATKSLDDDLARVDRQLHKISSRLEQLDQLPTTRPWVRVIEARVVRRATKLRAALERAGVMYWPERLHKVRIAVKKLRYAVELSLDASLSGTKADALALKRSQDLLGRLHDLQTLIDYIRRLPVSIELSDSSSRHESDALFGSLENDCRRLHGRYVRGRSAMVAMCDRLVAPVAVSRRGAARRAG